MSKQEKAEQRMWLAGRLTDINNNSNNNKVTMIAVVVVCTGNVHR